MTTISVPPPGAVETGARRIDTDALARELRSRTNGEVRFDDGARALYATDSSNYRQVPLGVVLPRTVDDIVTAMATARELDAPVLLRGGGTSLCGQTCNAALVIDTSKYLRRIVALDPGARTAVVEPGCVADTLNAAAAAHGLMFPCVPATHRWCTIGGMIGNNSCGTHSLMGGKTDDNVISLDVLTYDGTRMRLGPTSDADVTRISAAGGRRAEIYDALSALRDHYADEIRRRFPDIPRRVSGYNLPHLLPEHDFNVARAIVGSESTCVAVLEATVRLVAVPKQRVLLVIGYESIERGGEDVPRLLEHRPIALEGIDGLIVKHMAQRSLHGRARQHLPDGNGWLIVEFEGDTVDDAHGRAQAARSSIQGSGIVAAKVMTDLADQAEIWEVREGGLGATAWERSGDTRTWEGWEDSAVPPDRVGAYLRDLKALYVRYRYDGALYGHFGQGCIHTRVNFDLQSAAGINHFRHFLDDAADLVVRYGGSISGEHGDGQSKAALLPKMYGASIMEAFVAFKRIWDPQWRMNPGKVVDAYDPVDNLRLGPGYHTPRPKTHFALPDDEASFGVAALRCVGVGKCRVQQGQLMCPSYQVTFDEEHSTRGRARLLWEMLNRDVIDGWGEEAVKDALDLCLSCKGCVGDCPVRVDMATYKAEFLSHYYSRRLRPRHAYAFGLIHDWARLAQPLAPLLNIAAVTPLAAIAKAATGMHPKRRIPRFARTTFRAWFRRRPPRNVGRPSLVLWPDTFNDHFHPQTARAAVTVLEALGYRVEVPVDDVCCGRPLYDYGMLGRAKRLLRHDLDALRPYLESGATVVGLEPSCVSVFREELPNLFPNDPLSKRLSASVKTLSEFVAGHVDFTPPARSGRAIVHGHCHDKAVLDFGAEVALLERMGLRVERPEASCCGMAGAFGFEREHYDVAMRLGERALLPRVRAAEDDTLVVADGFSCREQIRQGTGRLPLHLAEVLAQGMP